MGLCVYPVGSTDPFFWKTTAVSQLRTTGVLEEDLSPAVIMMEAPGWSSDHHSGEDNEVTVLPLPHKAAIAVSFQKRLWPQRNPSGCLPWPPLCANSQLGVFCLFVCWVEVLL